MTSRRWWVAVLMCVATAPPIFLAGQGRVPRVVMISVDGMMPSAYTGTQLNVPTLRALKASGAWAQGVRGILPTLTYPSHTTLITGVVPAVHGVIDNRIVDPENRSNTGWYWYAEAIRVPTLPGAVRARGLTAAAVTWPVTVGMDLDYQVPEFSRSAHPETLSLISALSRPARLLEYVATDRGKAIPWPFTDTDRADVARFLIRRFRPHFLMIHLTGLDEAQHATGPGSPASADTLERIDGNIATIVSAVDASGLRADTTVAVVSDHGFLPTVTQLQLNTLFQQERLLTADASGRITSWLAYFHPSGGTGYVYLKDAQDAALRDRVWALLQRMRNDPTYGIETLWTRADLDRLGAHPDATFGLAMKPGFFTARGLDALLKPTIDKGGHGYDPTHAELNASLILSGAAITRTGDLGIIRLTQVAPTLARLLGVSLSPQADRPIWDDGPAPR